MTMIKISTSHFLYIYNRYVWLNVLDILFIVTPYFLFAIIYQTYMINMHSYFLSIPLLQLHTAVSLMTMTLKYTISPPMLIISPPFSLHIINSEPFFITLLPSLSSLTLSFSHILYSDSSTTGQKYQAPLVRLDWGSNL